MIIKTGLKGYIRSIRYIKKDTAFVMRIVNNQHQYGKNVRHYAYNKLHRKINNIKENAFTPGPEHV
jgi:hypothetical protein